MRIIVFRFLKSKNLAALFTCIFVLQLTASAQKNQKITLREAIDLALANNLQVRQTMFQADISVENLKQSKFESVPSLGISTSAYRQFGLYFDQASGRVVDRNDEFTGSINTAVPLFQGFSLRNKILQNKALFNSNVSNVEKVKNDLLLSVITTYLQAMANKDLIVASDQQLELSKEQLNIAQRNFDVGNKTLADLAQAKAQVANNELSLTNAQNAYDLSILELKQLMEMDMQQNIELEIPVVPSLAKLETGYSASTVYNQAVENYPDIRVAKYNTEAASYGLKVAKGNLYPSLSFVGGVGTRYSSTLIPSFTAQLDQNVNKYVGLQLNIPIFNNYRSRSSVNIAKIQYENAKVSEQLAKNNLNKVVSQAVLDLRTADKRYYATKSAFESSKEAFDVSRKRYEVGLVSPVELNTSQVNYNKAEFDFIQAKYELLFRSKVVDFYLGNPINL